MTRNLVLIDPPWNHRVWSKKGESRSASTFYNCMTNEELLSLSPLIKSAFGNNSIMGMWTTGPQLTFSLELLKEWGYEYKTTLFTWIKLNKKFIQHFGDVSLDEQGIDRLQRMSFWGMGYYSRANPEFVILGTKGNDFKRIAKNIHSVVYHPFTKHSEKPLEINRRFEALFKYPEDKIYELFARRQYGKWICTGNELDGLDIREFLENLSNEKNN